MTWEMNLARKLFASDGRLETGASSLKTDVLIGTAVTDSENGYVTVEYEGQVTYGDVQANIIPTGPNVKAGDTVIIGLAGGVGKHPTVENVPGWGDRIVLKVDELYANYAAIEVLVAEKASIDDLEAAEARIQNVEAETAKIENLTAEELEASTAYIATLEAGDLHASNLLVDHVKVDSLDVDDINAATAYVGALEAGSVEASDLIADHATVGSLDTNYAHITNGVIDTATIGHASVNGLSANYAHVTNGVIDTATIGHASVNGLSANYAHVTNGVIDTATIGYASVNGLSANYAQIDLANVDNAWIEDGVIKDAAIVDAQILGVSANKLTAGTIDASNINVANLRADSLVVNRLNGQPVLGGYTAVNSNASGYSSMNPSAQGWYEISNGQMVATTDTSVDDTKAYYTTSQSVALYDQNYIDGIESQLNQRIDGAIETYSGTVAPTLVNYPYTDWYDTTTSPVTDTRAEHVGDLYYVVNEASDEDGYCYRFYYDQTSHQYMWVLIKDSDVTAALSDISDLKTFETNTTSWINTTDEGLEQIRTNHTTLSGVVDKTVKKSVQLWYTKANTTAPNKPTAQVTNNNITGVNSYNKWNLAVPAWNATYPNYFFCWQYELADGTYDWSPVIRDVAMGESQSTSRNAQTTANANIKTSVQLWYTKSNSTKPNKPSTVVSTDDPLTGNAWNLAVPTYNSLYPHYFYCYQQQKGDNTYQWTDVVYDKGTTEAMEKAQAALPHSTFSTFEQTTFKDVKDTVDEQSSTITQLTESVQYGGDNLLVNRSAIENYNSSGLIVDYDPSTRVFRVHGKNTSTGAARSVGSYSNLLSSALAPEEKYTFTLYEVSGDFSASGLYVQVNVYSGSSQVGPWSVGTSHGNRLSHTAECPSGYSYHDAFVNVFVGVDQGSSIDIDVSFRLKLERGPFSTPWNYSAGDVSTMSNTVNVVQQTATSNSAVLTSLTTTLGTNADGTTKVGDIMDRTSEVEQDLDTIKNRVTKTEMLSTHYASCSTAIGTAAKTATISPAVTGWTLYTGAVVTVRFEKGNSASTMTLNVNDTGAKSVVFANGTTSPDASAIRWETYTTATFMYDGTYWRYTGGSSEQKRIVSAETSITQTADSITSLVANNDTYTAPDGSTQTNTIKSAIEQKADGVTLSALRNDFNTYRKGENLYSAANEVPGYLASPGTSIASPSSTQLEVTSDWIPVTGASTVSIQTWVEESKSMWLAYAFYPDKDLSTGTSRPGKSGTGTYLAYEDVAVPSNANYLRVSYRSYGMGRCKVEINGTTAWSEASPDVSIYSAKAEIKVTTDGINSEVSKISSAKYVNSSTASWTLANIKTYAAEGHSEGWNVASTDNLRVGDTVYIKGTDSTRNCTVYIKTTVTSITSSTRFIGTSHGYEDVLPVETIKSTINQSSDSVKIQANHVEIDGTAVFSAISSDVNSAIDDKVAAIEVGGRNLLRRTASPSIGDMNDGYWAKWLSGDTVERTLDGIKLTSSGSSSSFRVPLAYKGAISIGETLTLSFDYRGNITGTGAIYFMAETAPNVSATMSALVESTTDWVHFEQTFSFSGSPGGEAVQFMFPYKGASGKWFEIKDSSLKLERGNVATDWSPAPEDTQSAIIAGRQWYAECTTAAGTVAKVATITPATTDFTLEVGRSVDVKFSVTNTGAVGSLTLDVNGTGAKAIKTQRNNSITNLGHAGVLYANVIIRFVYNGTYWLATENYNNTYNQAAVSYSQNVKAASEGYVGTHIIMGDSTGYRNVAAGKTFDLGYPLLYYATAATTTIASGSTANNHYTEKESVNFSVNGTIQSGAAYKNLYLKGTVVGNIFTVASENYLTCVEPIEPDGFFYIPLGVLSNATTGHFSSSKSLYAYIDGKFRQATPTEVVAEQQIYIQALSVSDVNSITLPTTWVEDAGESVLEDEGLRTNLLAAEPKAHNGASYNAYDLSLSEPIESETVYTLNLRDVNVSHTGKTVDNLGVWVYYNGGNIALGGWKGASYFTNGHAERLSITFTPHENSAATMSGGNVAASNNMSHSSASTRPAYIRLYNSVPSASGTMSMEVGSWHLAKGDAVAAPSWTTKHPTYRSMYPVTFVATQRKRLDGTVTCSDPLPDDTTTVIDGGNLITGSVQARHIASGSLTIANMSTEVTDVFDTVEGNTDDLSDLADRTSTLAGKVATFEAVETRVNSHDGQLQTIMNSLKFAEGELELKTQSGSDSTSVALTSEKMEFRVNGSEVTYVSNEKLYIRNAQVLDTMQMGGFAWIPRSNGNLSLKWLGGVSHMNLLLGSGTLTGWKADSGCTIADGVATLTGSSSNWNACLYTPKYDISLYDGTTSYIVSFDYKSTAACAFSPFASATSEAISTSSWTRTKYIGWQSQITLPSTGGEWVRYSLNPRTIAVSQLTSGSGNCVSGYVQFYARSNVTLYMRNVKLEIGTEATPWSKNPND